jgi:hypothetical protein
MAHQPSIDKLFHLAPGAHVALMDVGHGVRAAFRDLAAGRMMIGKGQCTM